MSGLRFSWNRVTALAYKDARELMRNPGAIVPAILMVFASLFPAFLVIVVTPKLVGETLEESDFAEIAVKAASVIPELAGLSGTALVQTFLFHQFSLMLLLVPIVSTTALATHAVIGEKTSRALEPLLATPISTLELLMAKTLTPFLFALSLMWIAAAIYLLGAAALAEPGVWRSVAGPRFFAMFVVLGPQIELASLVISVIVSSRSADPRSAQQMSALLILPVTILLVAQLTGFIVVGPTIILLVSLAMLLLNVLLLKAGVRVFDRESILTRWR